MNVAPPPPELVKAAHRTWPGRLWHWLAVIQAAGPDAVHPSARLLAGLLLMLCVLVGLSLLTVSLTNATPDPWHSPTFLVAMGSTLLFLGAFGLNRAGHYRPAATLTISILALGLWASIWANRAVPAEIPWLLLYVLLSVTLASLLLSPRATGLLAAAHLVAAAALPLFVAGLDGTAFVRALIFVGFVSALVMVVAIVRQRHLAQIGQQASLLVDSEERLRLFLDHVPDATLLLDPHDLQVNWPIVECNEAACRMNGYERAELIGQPIDLLNATLSQSSEQAARLEHLRREGTLHFETVHRRKDGTEFPIQVSTSLITLGGRELVLGIDRDITERKQAEAALRQSEERFELVSYATNDAVWDWNLVTDRIWWNRGVQQLFGYTVAEASQDSAWWEEHMHPDERSKIVAHIKAEIKGGAEFWSREYRVQRADGTYANVFDRGYVIRDEQGKPVRMIGAVLDITERKRIEEALRESEALFRTSFEHSPLGVALVSPKGEYLRVNRSLCEMLGYSEAELCGHPSSDFMHPDDVAASQLQARRLVAGEIKVADIEKRYLHKSGRVIWAQRVMAALRVGEGEPRYYLSQLHDISERRLADEALKVSNEKLTGWLGELEERTREMAMLNEMVSLFQNCHTLEEAYSVVSKMAPGLFRESEGALSIVHASRDLVETMAHWGEARDMLPVFQMDDCWALRRARPHVVVDSRQSLACRHLAAVPPAYLCVPLFAQGELLGCLHVSTPAGQLTEQRQQLVKTVADAIALSLANLRLRDSLRQQSIIDVLTGLFNRRYMEETLEREVRRCARANRPLSIIMMDLDHFKAFNDTHGHAAGDVLLSELGLFLKAHIRAEDIVCRYGGEEFTMILPDGSLAVAAERAERLQAGMHALRVEFGGQVIGAGSMSLGVAAFPEHGASGAAVLRAADRALYRAKHEGRDQVVVAGELEVETV